MSFVLFSLYVDNILIVGNDKGMTIGIKEWLSLKFEIKYMGET